MTPLGELLASLLRRICNSIGKSGLTLERYQVFTGLRRLGCTVVRAPTWDESYTGMNGHATVPTAQGQLTEPTRRDDQWLQYVIRSDILALVHRLVRYLLLVCNLSLLR
jgi:hypothetical protein